MGSRLGGGGASATSIQLAWLDWHLNLTPESSERERRQLPPVAAEAKMSSNPGAIVYVSVNDPTCGQLKFKGLLIERKATESIVAVNAAPRLAGISEGDVQVVDDARVVFITVPKIASSLTRPAAWSLADIVPIRPMPRQVSSVLDAFNDLDEEPVTAESGAEIAENSVSFQPQVPHAAAAASGSKFSMLSGTPAGLGNLLQGAAVRFNLGAEDDKEDDEPLGPFGGGPTARLPPGVNDPIPREAQQKPPTHDVDPNAGEKIMARAADLYARGELSAKNMLMLRAFKFFAEGRRPQKEEKKPPNTEGDCEENEDSDEEYRNKKRLWAFDDLDAIGQAVIRQPTKLTEEFEEEEHRIIVVLPGMPWSLQGMRKALYWGRNASLNRCASLDLEAYMHLARAEDLDIHGRRAKAQLVQSFRGKYQASLDGGSWTQAWLLTGVEDPCARRKWAAPQWQVSAAANYIKATGELQKVTGLGGGFQRQGPSTYEEAEDEPEVQQAAKASIGRTRRRQEAKARQKELDVRIE